MSQQVVMGALCQCPMGAAPTPLAVLPVNKTMATTPAATIADCVPFLNIIPFGVCISMANPAVAAATAAALGVLVPMPCTPCPAGTWAPGAPTVTIGGQPALNNSSKLTCAFGGCISITMAGQMTVMIP